MLCGKVQCHVLYHDKKMFVWHFFFLSNSKLTLISTHFHSYNYTFDLQFSYFNDNLIKLFLFLLLQRKVSAGTSSEDPIRMFLLYFLISLRILIYIKTRTGQWSDTIKQQHLTDWLTFHSYTNLCNNCGTFVMCVNVVVMMSLIEYIVTITCVFVVVVVNFFLFQVGLCM